MIQVKENLLNIENLIITPTDNDYENRIIKLPESLINGHKYTFSAKVEQTKNGSGKLGLIIRRRGYVNDVTKLLTKNDYSVSFIFNQEVQEEIVIYPDIQGQTNNVGAEFYNISIVKGDGMDIYVPNKNSVKPENQAIFPIGGGITKSYLYRGYKGVGIC